jgi:diguanylate cyclase (GGDEF)-like protein
MLKEPADKSRIFLSAGQANRHEVRFALVATLVSVVIFFLLLPFATRPLAHIPAFIPAYESALVVGDLITAVMLFGQFSIFRSRALFALASGYLFTALIAISHMLSFPDVFSSGGLLGSGPQTTIWLYMFWHGGFPLFVLLYARLDAKGGEAVEAGGMSRSPRVGAGIVILAGVAVILSIVCGLTVVATVTQDDLPVLIIGNRYTPMMTVIVSCCWTLSLLALILLWRRRPRTVLDLWLAVVMCAWLCDIALSAVLDAERFDAGWYAGRIYGLLAAGALLIVLLSETCVQYARLAKLSLELRAANDALEQLSNQDALTDIANRRSFDRYLAAQITVARRHKRTLALILLDVDSFKAFNDHYGHQAGDECLRRVAAALRSCCRRPADMAARYGGEEFAIILPETELVGATEIAELVRDAVSRLMIRHEHSPASPYVSVSGGVAVLRGNGSMIAEQLIAAADEALYKAKYLGRNRMVSMQVGADKTVFGSDAAA